MNFVNTLNQEFVLFKILYSESGNSSIEGYHLSDNDKIGISLAKEIRKKIKYLYNELRGTKEEFNEVILTKTKKGISIEYQFNNEAIRKDQFDTARLFPQWINDQMISIIYNQEFPNGPTDLDKEVNPMYVSTWDEGDFEFVFEDKKLSSYSITLVKQRKLRKMQIQLPDYFIQALEEHYTITNEILSNQWKKWNKLTIHSPHNDLPYGQFEKYVQYELV